MAVLVPLEAEHVRSLREARRLLAALASLGVQVELVVDDLDEVLSRARSATPLWERPVHIGGKKRRKWGDEQ